MTDKVERGQNLRRSNAAGPHKVKEPCEHKTIDITTTGQLVCRDCGERM